MTAAAGAILIGTVIGALAGFYRGWIDEALMRLTEAAQTVPNFLLALALVAVLGPATWSVVTAIALVSWPATARIVRAEFLSLREREFVLACRTMGMGDGAADLRPDAAQRGVVDRGARDRRWCRSRSWSNPRSAISASAIPTSSAGAA